ncbi:cytochrome P450 [Nocardia sp. XZ_19_385]|uniref:cytochrome P450 n=1 Tax=Nocardia sp. XZ_19_385 TaxID=2769488 RepID=UPI001890930D|nr:cytochrome P450 [Nocardia sp. XZ_19_385]
MTRLAPTVEFEAWSKAGDAYAALTAVREAGPVRPVLLPDGPEVWLVTRYAEAKQALSDPRLVKDLRRLHHADHGFGGHRYRDDVFAVFGRQPANSDGKDHNRLRMSYRPFLSPRAVQRWRPAIEKFAAQQLDILARIDRPDLRRDFADPIAARGLAHVVGIPDRLLPALANRAREAVTGLPPEEMAVISTDLMDLVMEIIADKRAQPDDTLISHLLDLHASGQWTLAEVVGVTVATVTAGQTTTATLISVGGAVIAEQPGLRPLLGNPSTTKDLIEELLRYRGPAVNATWRFAPVDLELGGVAIPAGAIVLVSLASANRDPRAYSDPETVCPRRAESEPAHLGFGHGPHFCAGAALSRLVAAITLPALFDRFPRLSLAVAIEDLEWITAVVEWRPTAVPVRLEPS